MQSSTQVRDSRAAPQWSFRCPAQCRSQIVRTRNVGEQCGVTVDCNTRSQAAGAAACLLVLGEAERGVAAVTAVPYCCSSRSSAGGRD